MNRHSIYFLLLLAVSISIALAAEEPVFKVVVSEGDWLINICEKYLEDPQNWPEVARFNQLKNPNLILPGEIIAIPVRLMKETPVEGEVRFLQGISEVLLEGKETWLPLRLHDKVPEGSKVRTAKDGAVEVAFDGAGNFYLRPDSRVRLSTVRKKGDSYLFKFFLEVGKTMIRIRQATGQETRLEVETPSAICAARGTDFRTTLDEKDFTRSEVLSGQVSVEAMKTSVRVKEGEGTLVKKGEPPLEPRKLLLPPAPKEVQPLCKKLPLSLAFKSIAGAVAYRIVLAKDRESKGVLFEKTIRPDEPFEVRELEDGKFFLLSQSVDSLGLEGTPSEPVEIQLRLNPFPPVIQAPSEGMAFQEKPVQFQWLKVKDAASYHVQIAEDREFQKILEDRLIRELQYAAKDLENKRYYFRVSSMAEDGYEGVWSNPISFTIEPPSFVPVLKRLSVAQKRVHLRWLSLGRGIIYHFQMSRQKDFSEILVDEHVTHPEIWILQPEASGIYYVRVSAIDSKGFEGSFSSPWSFKT